MPNPRTRQRHLAKLAERRAAERRKKRRQRMLAAIVAVAMALAGGGFLIATFLGGGSAAPSSHRPSPSVSPPGTVACGGTVPAAASKKKPFYKAAPKNTIEAKKTYVMKVQTSCGTFDITLDAKTAPHTVNSLVFLGRHHYFDGLQINRIAQGFVIQGGDPRTAAGNPPPNKRNQGPGYTTVDRPPRDATYPVGTVSMAKGGTDPPGAAGSEFFVVTAPGADTSLAPGGKPSFALVGKVTKGMDVVQRIAALPTQGGVTDGPPLDQIYLVKVTIEVT